jgi:hypothetical protein
MTDCGAQWRGEHSSQQTLRRLLINGNALCGERLNAFKQAREQVVNALQREALSH